MSRTRSLRWVLTVAAVLAAGLAAAPARAQIESREGIALRDQIDELRHEVHTLQQQIANGRGGSMLGAAVPMQAPPGGGSTNDVTAQLLVRVGQMEGQIRDLRGHVDELQNQLQQQTADLGKRIDDLTFLVENPRAAAAAAAAARKAAAAGPTTAPSPPAGTTAPQPPTGVLGTMPSGPPPTGSPSAGVQGPTRTVPRTPELSMQEGTAALARRDYATAETAAHEILNGNRTSPRAYDAMFLLAQAQYGQRQYSQAALSYDDTYNRAHRGPHAEDALLGLANSLVGLNDRPSACQAIAKLHAEFPTLRPEFRDQVAATHQRAGCR
jgi:TolA-binding protein